MLQAVQFGEVQSSDIFVFSRNVYFKKEIHKLIQVFIDEAQLLG